MPSNPETVLKKIDLLPDHQAELCLRFRDFLLEENDSSERNCINYLKIINMFAIHIGNKKFEDVTRDDVLSFLDQRKKAIEDDPEKNGLLPGMII